MREKIKYTVFFPRNDQTSNIWCWPIENEPGEQVKMYLLQNLFIIHVPNDGCDILLKNIPCPMVTLRWKTTIKSVPLICSLFCNMWNNYEWND